MEHAFIDLSELATFLATVKPRSCIRFGEERSKIEVVLSKKKWWPERSKATVERSDTGNWRLEPVGRLGAADVA
jgi:hypothetical protein